MMSQSCAMSVVSFRGGTFQCEERGRRNEWIPDRGRSGGIHTGGQGCSARALLGHISACCRARRLRRGGGEIRFGFSGGGGGGGPPPVVRGRPAVAADASASPRPRAARAP